MDQVKDHVLPNQSTSFWIAQRFRENLEFVKKDDIVISIGFYQNKILKIISIGIKYSLITIICFEFNY